MHYARFFLNKKTFACLNKKIHDFKKMLSAGLIRDQKLPININGIYVNGIDSLY